MSAETERLAARLREARQEGNRYATGADAARAMGVNIQTYLGHENGSRGFKDSANRYADFYGVNLDWLIAGRGPMKRGGASVPQPAVPAETTGLDIKALPLDLPVRGNAACGEDGLFELNGEVLDHVRRPPRLMNVKDAYALWIDGESMAPWREHGGLVVVHPHQPIRINDYVVVQLKANDGEPVPAYIKRLVKRTPSQLVLLQFNPRKEITIPLAKVRAIHRILDWDEAMGI